MTLEQYMQCLALHAHDDDDMDEALSAGRKRLLTDLTNAERCVQRAPVFIGICTLSFSNMLTRHYPSQWEHILYRSVTGYAKS
jgi:hypothetical protein